MIFITVKAAFMECKKQFETDNKALLFLKRLKKLQLLHIRQQIINDPEWILYNQAKYRCHRAIARQLKKDLKLKHSQIVYPIRVDILNTEAAQLNFHHKLK